MKVAVRRGAVDEAVTAPRWLPPASMQVTHPGAVAAAAVVRGASGTAAHMVRRLDAMTASHSAQAPPVTHNAVAMAVAALGTTSTGP